MNTITQEAHDALLAELEHAREVLFRRAMPRELRRELLYIGHTVDVGRVEDLVYAYAKAHPRADGRFDCPFCDADAKGWANLHTLVVRHINTCAVLGEFWKYNMAKGKRGAHSSNSAPVSVTD